MQNSRSMKSLLVLTGLLVAAGCGEGTMDPSDEPAVVASASGNSQTGDIDTALPDPITVRVTRDGAAVSGTSVNWTVTAGGGSASPTTSTTDAGGQASTTWTLGSTVGAQTLEASVAGATGSPVMFFATGEDPVPPSAAAVTVQDNSFNPNSTRLATGGTVTWTWAGSNPHNVTFTSGSNSTTQTGGTFMRTFATEGTFSYQCTIHSGMTGTVEVETP